MLAAVTAASQVHAVTAHIIFIEMTIVEQLYVE
jgi:hypothetical protein